jgi:hypothetical protein
MRVRFDLMTLGNIARAITHLTPASRHRRPAATAATVRHRSPSTPFAARGALKLLRLCLSPANLFPRHPSQYTATPKATTTGNLRESDNSVYKAITASNNASATTRYPTYSPPAIESLAIRPSFPQRRQISQHLASRNTDQGLLLFHVMAEDQASEARTAPAGDFQLAIRSAPEPLHCEMLDC